MINKLEIINERINNLIFLIEAYKDAINNPQETPSNKIPVDLHSELASFELRLEALIVEKQALTNQV